MSIKKIVLKELMREWRVENEHRIINRPSYRDLLKGVVYRSLNDEDSGWLVTRTDFNKGTKLDGVEGFLIRSKDVYYLCNPPKDEIETVKSLRLAYNSWRDGYISYIKEMHSVKGVYEKSIDNAIEKSGSCVDGIIKDALSKIKQLFSLKN